MSHWNGYRIQDILEDEDRGGINHFLPFQVAEQTLESLTTSDSHKKPRFEAVIDVKSSICREGPTDEVFVLSKDEKLLPSAFKEGISNTFDLQWPLIPEKAAQALALPTSSTRSIILDCPGACSFSEAQNNIGKTTSCSDYAFSVKKLCDISSANAFVGAPTKEQRDGENDLHFYDCPTINDFEDFDRTFRNIDSMYEQGNTAADDDISWFSPSLHGFHGVEDTLQSVILSSVSELSVFNNVSNCRNLCTDNLPAIDQLACNTETPFSTSCGSFPTYADPEGKGKLVASELAYDHTGIAEKVSAFEEIGYGNECRDPNMINMALKELCTATGMKFNPTSESIIQSSLSGCGLIQNVQDQELLSSVFPKQNFFTESFDSNRFHPCNPQAQMNEALTLQHITPTQTTLNSSAHVSRALPGYVASNNPSSHVLQSMGIITEPFSMPSLPLEKNYKIHECHKFPAAESDSVQRKYKFEDEVEGVRKPVQTSLNLLNARAGFSAFQENSCMSSSFLDDETPFIANFQQLRMVIDRLGVRTKLCIRDSLYRLARSAEQSHCYGAANNVRSGGSTMIGLPGAKDSKRPREILCMSISTNAIERAVAYLLFHKSLESDASPCWQC